MGKYISHMTSIHAIPGTAILKVVGEIEGKKFAVFVPVPYVLLDGKDFLETYAKTIAEYTTKEMLDDNQQSIENLVLYGDGSPEPKGIIKA